LPDLPFVCPDLAEPLVDRHVQRKAPPPGAFPDQGQRVLDRGGKVEVRQFELHPPGFDLRQIEDVVDEGQQVLPRSVDVLQVLVLFLVQLLEHALGQHFGEPDDRVERGAQLVGHVGEELGLVLAGDLELPALGLSSPLTVQ